MDEAFGALDRSRAGLSGSFLDWKIRLRRAVLL